MAAITAAPNAKMPLIFLAIFFTGFAWSFCGPSDAMTWFLEIVPFALGLPLVVYLHRQMPLTNLTLGILTLAALMMCMGAYYTYSQVPLGFWMQDWFGFERNHYDRLGHFFQGVAPALLFREVLMRHTELKPGRGWLFFIVVSISLALSACYELLEWAAVLIYGDGTASFLGTQGDIWDAQADMLMALSGAILTLLLFRRTQTMQFRAIQRRQRRDWRAILKGRREYFSGLFGKYRRKLKAKKKKK